MLLGATMLQAQPRYDMQHINREQLDRGVVAIVSAQAVGGGHPDIAVGILGHVEYLIAGQAVGRTDMAAVG